MLERPEALLFPLAPGFWTPAHLSSFTGPFVGSSMGAAYEFDYLCPVLMCKSALHVSPNLLIRHRMSHVPYIHGECT